MLSPPSGAPNERESGSALIWALLFMVLTSGMVVSHSTFLAASRKEREASYNRDSLATTFARSGMVEATNWFQKRARQPVLDFDPVLDLTANPPVNETIDPTLGLVREFQISGSLWGRYEVRRDEASDISNQRGAIPGTAWELRIRSYIFRQNDPDKRYDEEPNRLIATTAVTDEIRQLRLTQPGTSAVSIDDRSRITLGPNAEVYGNGGAAFAHDDLAIAPMPTVDSAAVVDGAADFVGVPTFAADPESIFGVTPASLRAYADIVLTRATTRAFPKTGPIEIKNTTVYVPRDFTSDRQLLVENSLLFVNGNLTLNSTEQSRIRGVVYVKGDAILNGALELDGTLIVRGQLIAGTQVTVVVIRFDSAAITELRQSLNRYRRRRGKKGRA